MAFPTIAASTQSARTSNDSTHTVSLPTGITPGDLLIVYFTSDGNPTVTWPSGWTQLFSVANGSSPRHSCAYRIADGTEGSTITVTTSDREKSTHVALRITGHDSATAPEAATATGNSNAPDPPTLAPTWGVDDTLWLASCGVDNGNRTVTGYPTNYTNVETISAGARAGCVTSVASRNYTGGSQNPDSFTLSASNTWVASTLAVRPAGGGTIVAVGQASESDAGQTVGHSFARTLGLAGETDAGFAAQPERIYGVGLSAETDSAFAIGRSFAQALGLAAETGAAFAIQPGRFYTLGEPTENDVAHAVAVVTANNVPVGLATETEQGFALSSAKVAGVALASEADSGFAIQPERDYALGFAPETDNAFALTVARGINVGLATESVSAFSIGHARGVSVGLAPEADAASAIVANRPIDIGIATESDAAFTVGIGRSVAVGLSAESDIAFALATPKTVNIGLSAESDVAQALGIGRGFNVGEALENDTGQPVAVVRIAAIGEAVETDAAFSVSLGSRAVAVGGALEQDQALFVLVNGLLRSNNQIKLGDQFTHARWAEVGFTGWRRSR